MTEVSRETLKGITLFNPSLRTYCGETTAGMENAEDGGWVSVDDALAIEAQALDRVRQALDEFEGSLHPDPIPGSEGMFTNQNQVAKLRAAPRPMTALTKTCPGCGEVKPLDEYHRKASEKDGRQSRCKDCCADYHKNDAARRNKKALERYEKNRDAELERCREWGQNNRDRVAERSREWRRANPERAAATDKRRRDRHPEKFEAREQLRKEVAAGKIVKPDACERCRQAFPPPLIHGHHYDYSKPLDVEWLCKDCHHAEHAALATLNPSEEER